MRQVLTHKASSRRRGFTLIELVVVLMVLAILSGLVVAIAGWVRRSANYGAASSNQATLMANMELFRTTYGNNFYPDRFDSLLKADKTEPTYLNQELKDTLKPGVLTKEGFANFSKGLTTVVVMDHLDEKDIGTAEEGNPGNTGTIERTLVEGGEVAFVDPASPNGARLVTQLYGTAGLGDAQLVAFGVGPRCSAIGRTMQSAPFYTNVDPSLEYNRFIAVFAIYEPRSGRRAQLKAVLSSRGRTQNRNLSEFWQSTNPE